MSATACWAARPRIHIPLGITVDPHGDVVFGDADNKRIRRIDSHGIISTIAGTGVNDATGDGGPATKAALADPENVVFDASGNLYITDTVNDRLRRVDSHGVISTLASHKGGNGLAIDDAGNFYVTNADAVYRIDTKGVVTLIAGKPHWACPPLQIHGGAAALFDAPSARPESFTDRPIRRSRTDAQDSSRPTHRTRPGGRRGRPGAGDDRRRVPPDVPVTRHRGWPYPRPQPADQARVEGRDRLRDGHPGDRPAGVVRWHSHPGVVIVSVVSGSLTFYDKHCHATVHAAGSAFVESGNDPGLVRNFSDTTPATVNATYIVPAGTPNTSLRVDKDNPGCAQS